MTADQYITIAILALTFALLTQSKVPPAAVFVGALTLMITFLLGTLLTELTKLALILYARTVSGQNS